MNNNTHMIIMICFMISVVMFAIGFGFSESIKMDEWAWRDHIKEIDKERTCEDRYFHAWIQDKSGDYHCVKVTK